MTRFNASMYAIYHDVCYLRMMYCKILIHLSSSSKLLNGFPALNVFVYILFRLQQIVHFVTRNKKQVACLQCIEIYDLATFYKSRNIWIFEIFFIPIWSWFSSKFRIWRNQVRAYYFRDLNFRDYALNRRMTKKATI